MNTGRVVVITGAAGGVGALLVKVDVLINCAGFFPITPFDAISVEDWHKVLDINLTGSFLMVRAFLPLMKNNGGGRIVNRPSASGAPCSATSSPRT